jgi:hypothetical protein
MAPIWTPSILELCAARAKFGMESPAAAGIVAIAIFPKSRLVKTIELPL